MLIQDDALAILDALRAGVTPIEGLEHIMVGRADEGEEIIRCLIGLKRGQSYFKFWFGDYGIGKSFILNYIRGAALQRNYIVSTIELNSRQTLFYGSQKQGLAFYSKAIESMSITGSRGGGLVHILRLLNEKTDPGNAAFSTDLRSLLYSIECSSASLDIKEVIVDYINAIRTGKEEEAGKYLKWLKGMYAQKAESKRETGRNSIISDNDYLEVILFWNRLIRVLGYDGFLINIDEGNAIFEVTNPIARNMNYERILMLYNSLYSGKEQGMMINLAGTRRELLDNYKRGIRSYPALQSRIGAIDNQEVAPEMPAYLLKPLKKEEKLYLLEKLVGIFHIAYPESNIGLDPQIAIRFFMNISSQLGSDEKLLPRELIRTFLVELATKRNRTKTITDAN
jgi:hypothetical protein